MSFEGVLLPSDCILWSIAPSELVKMRIVEQRKLIQDLKAYVSKMSRQEQYDLDMFAKRDKDDEELDNLSFSKLEAMHKRYVVKKSKADIEALFKKYSSEK